jgi:signal transduction histidine kinase
MRERVEMLGGHFHVRSTPGEGTTVTAQIPSSRTGRVNGGALMKLQSL